MGCQHRLGHVDMTDPGPISQPAHAFGNALSRVRGSAGVAGIIFSLLFVASLVSASLRPPDGLDAAGLVRWFEEEAQVWTTLAALYLAPLTGVAFLWFIGVVRARVGAREDQLFATVFLGSGLLFVGMYWAAAAQFASLVAGNRFDAAPPLTAATIEAVRSSAFSFLFVLAARAAAVFVLVTSTIIMRSKALPHVLAYVGYVVGLLMLLSLSFLQWIVLLFPVWVFLVSGATLIAERRVVTGPGDRSDG